MVSKMIITIGSKAAETTPKKSSKSLIMMNVGCDEALASNTSTSYLDEVLSYISDAVNRSNS